MAKKTVKLTFTGEMIREPLIYRLGREFDVVPNIFRAAVAGEEGWVLLELEGEEEELRRVTDFLEGVGVKVEESRGPLPK